MKVKDLEKEEQLWEVQRVVTHLKRQVSFGFFLPVGVIRLGFSLCVNQLNEYLNVLRTCNDYELGRIIEFYC